VGSGIFVDMDNHHTKSVRPSQHRVGVVNVDLGLNQASADHPDSSAFVGYFHCEDRIDRSGDTMVGQDLVSGFNPVDDESDDGMVSAIHH